MTVPAMLAGLWVLSLLAVLWIVLREIVLPAIRPPRLAPDPAFADRALREDDEVAVLDAIWEMPTREPLR